MRGVSLSAAAIVVVLTFSLAEAAQKPGAPAPPTTAAANLVNLNTATIAQLETLPGIGARTAQRIIEHRQKNGGFKKIEEILENSRSGPVLLGILDFAAHRPVSRRLQKSQEISR